MTLDYSNLVGYWGRRINNFELKLLNNCFGFQWQHCLLLGERWEELSFNLFLFLFNCILPCHLKRFRVFTSMFKFMFYRQGNKFRRDISTIIIELGFQIIKKTKRLYINKADIWNSALNGFRNQKFNPSYTIEVAYVNENDNFGTEHPGSKQEFLSLLMQHLENSPLFEGSLSKNLSLNSQGNYLLLYILHTPCVKEEMAG